jgi:hypothetical protein
VPVNKEYLKSKIDRVREEIGRDVDFYTVVTGQNPDFTASGFYNPLTYTGYVKTLETTTVKARVHWASDERITATPGGKYYIGDCTLTVDPDYHELAQKAMIEGAYVVVDGRNMSVIGIDPKGAPEINRIRLICKAMGDKPDA